MRMKLSYKFFMTFLLTSVISVVLMVVTMHLYFAKNFLEFINKRNTVILNELSNVLSVEYKTYQGWDKLKNNHRAWRRLLQSVLPRKHFDGSHPPPPFFAIPHPPPDFERRDRKKRNSPFRRIALFDAQKHLIIGNRTPFKQQITRAIIVEEKTVGWLGIQKIEPSSSDRNQRETETLNELSNALSVEYQTYQGWEPLNNSRAWGKLLRAVLPRKPFDNTSQPVNFERKNKDFEKPPPPPDFERRKKGEQEERGWKRIRPFQRLALFDAQKHQILGNTAPFKQHLTEAIIVEEKTVGWVGIKKIENLSKDRDIVFLRQQANAFYFTGFFVLLMTALVAWWLSKHLLTPIQQLIKGTQALTSRQFNTTIEVHSTDELGQLANDFNRMAQTLKKYEKMRQQWLSDISHELRTPLSIMRGEIEAIQDGVREFNRDALDSLHAEVQSLSRIVEDLRELSAAETNTLSFKNEPINPLLILQDTLKVFQTQLSQHHIQVQDDLSLKANIMRQGDADRLIQLFSNLLENTLRYVDSPGILKIWHEQMENKLILNFVDSGPGVPEESIGRLFDRLYRVEQSRNRSKGGSGLGLAICKNIVEMHDGEITAANVPSSGLWIKIVFPL